MVFIIAFSVDFQSSEVYNIRQQGIQNLSVGGLTIISIVVFSGKFYLVICQHLSRAVRKIIHNKGKAISAELWFFI